LKTGNVNLLFSKLKPGQFELTEFPSGRITDSNELTDPILIAENLTKTYGRVRAVSDLNLQVRRGEVFALIGPNGAGKTTTIKMILGLTRPDHGLVRLLGEDPWDNPEVHSSLGVVFERSHFPGHEAAADYLVRTCRIFGLPASRANEVLDIVGLSNDKRKQIGSLSAGMLQKFAIGHAIVHGPRLIVADEMTSNLDPGARSMVLNLVGHLRNEQGTTFILSSHILQELGLVCDSVAIISDGKILVSGRLDQLYEKYATRVTRIATDKAELLLSELRKLPNVTKIESLNRELFIYAKSAGTTELYEEILTAAKKVDARILSITSDSRSLQQLYDSVMTSQGGDST